MPGRVIDGGSRGRIVSAGRAMRERRQAAVSRAVLCYGICRRRWTSRLNRDGRVVALWGLEIEVTYYYTDESAPSDLSSPTVFNRPG